MTQKTDKIAIVGAGALGGHVGAHLTREGHANSRSGSRVAKLFSAVRINF